MIPGAPPGVRSEIDRRVYTVRDDPQVQTATTAEILSKIPSVTLTPSGRVQLLGNSNVTILIDGRRPVNADAALRNLPASQIDRIEVMTNPSAQFSAEGTGGIINIITRQRTSPGLSGTVTTSLSTLGGGQLTIAPSLTRGRWSLEGSLGITRSLDEATTFTQRQLVGVGPSPTVDMTRDEQFQSTKVRSSASARIAFRPTDRETVSLSAQVYGADGDSRRVMRTAWQTLGFENFTEYYDTPDRISGGKAGFDFERKGPRDGEGLRISASADYLSWNFERKALVDFDSIAVTDNRYGETTDFETQGLSAKVDFDRPFGDSVLLAVGASWDREIEEIDQVLSILQGVGPGPALSYGIRRQRDTTAAYGTIQFSLGKWLVKPGLRIEGEDFDLRSPGSVDSGGDVASFPSVFVQRKLSDDLEFNLSYSRRISRPDIQKLSPYVVYSSETSARTGNPALRSENTDAYEARIDYTNDGFGLNLTIYDRRTSDVWVQQTLLTPDAISLTTTINAGERWDRGAEISVRGPWRARWKYNATVNLFSSRQQTLEAGMTRMRSDFTYTGNAQIEYRTNAEDGQQPDLLQLSLRYFGPQVQYQSSMSGLVRVDLTWRHPFSESVATVLSINDLLDSSDIETRLATSDLSEVTMSQGTGTTIRIALVYRFR